MVVLRKSLQSRVSLNEASFFVGLVNILSDLLNCFSKNSITPFKISFDKIVITYLLLRNVLVDTPHRLFDEIQKRHDF